MYFSLVAALASLVLSPKVHGPFCAYPRTWWFLQCWFPPICPPIIQDDRPLMGTSPQQDLLLPNPSRHGSMSMHRWISHHPRTRSIDTTCFGVASYSVFRRRIDPVRDDCVAVGNVFVKITSCSVGAPVSAGSIPQRQGIVPRWPQMSQQTLSENGSRLTQSIGPVLLKLVPGT